jgi:hypothetical protein
MHKIENKTLRRIAVVLTFPVLFVFNFFLLMLGISLYLLSFLFHNQDKLWHSAIHYWNTSEKLE